MVVACDLDGMLLAFPSFFSHFFKAMQNEEGHPNKIGILTGRAESQKEKMVEVLNKMDIHPDFFIGMPDDMREKEYPAGIFKATVCNELGVDLLFDDFETDDPQMLADFFSLNQKTVPFTSFAYDPDKVKV